MQKYRTTDTWIRTAQGWKLVTIRRQGSGLIGERSSRPAQTLSVEAADVMFVAGQPRSRQIFLRGADGRITGFVDRREGRDIPWTRVP